MVLIGTQNIFYFQCYSFVIFFAIQFWLLRNGKLEVSQKVWVILAANGNMNEDINNRINFGQLGKVA